MRELDPLVPVARLETLEDSLGVALFLPRAAAALYGVFGLLGLLLAASGIYGLLSYAVGQRRREIGVRLALGATPHDIVRLVLRRGLGLSLLGILAGAAASVAATRLLAVVLYSVSPTDVPTFLSVTILLAMVALAASYLPARRAAHCDVSRALHHE